MDEREQRGVVIAATRRLTPKGAAWIVPSCTETNKRYTVVPHATEPVCTCPDFELRGGRCKHIHAVTFTIQRDQNADGSVTETKTLTLTEKKTTYSRRPRPVLADPSLISTHPWRRVRVRDHLPRATAPRLSPPNWSARSDEPSANAALAQNPDLSGSCPISPSQSPQPAFRIVLDSTQN
jgi:hypothetical protein